MIHQPTEPWRDHSKVITGPRKAGRSAEYLQRVRNQLSLDIGARFPNLLAIDEGLRNGGFRANGKSMDLSPYRRHAQPIVDRAIGAIRNAVGNGVDIDEIVLVGGGGRYFLQGLEAAFPGRPIHESKDALFANVRGFHIIGQILCKCRGQ